MFKNLSNNRLYFCSFLLVFSFLTAGIIAYGSGNVIAAFILLPFLVTLQNNTPPFTKIAFAILMITFPITLQVFGKDAFSTGTVVIFVTLGWVISKVKASATITRDIPFFRILFILIAIALFGMFTKTPVAYWGPAIRHFLNFVSSIAVFFVIVLGQNIRGIANDNSEYIEKIISALLMLTVVHVFLMLLIFHFPWIEEYLSVFLRRNQENLGGHIAGGVYTRGTTVFTGGEEFGELLVLLFPFALYKLFTRGGKIYWFVIGALLIGMLISGTRSAFLLIIFQTLGFVYILVPAKYNSKKITITIGFVFVFILMLPILNEYSPILMDRVQITLDQLGQKDIVMIANRSSVWPLAWDLTVKTISLFGHGSIQAFGIGFPVKNFHNLYMSLMFQFGVIGSIVFFMFFFVLAKRLFFVAKKYKGKRGSLYLLTLTCLLSLFGFLINEIKFEFNRSDSYQQFVWCFFAVFYVIGTVWQNHKKSLLSKLAGDSNCTP